MPSDASPIELECIDCGGSGCDKCEGSGRIRITDCPLKLITEDVWEVIALAELFEKGLPPIAGGVLDQAKIFVDAASFIFQEKSYWKNKLGIID